MTDNSFDMEEVVENLSDIDAYTAQKEKEELDQQAIKLVSSHVAIHVPGLLPRGMEKKEVSKVVDAVKRAVTKTLEESRGVIAVTPPPTLNSLATISDVEKRAFSRKAMIQLYEAPVHNTIAPPPYIFVFIDPTRGGGSDFALTMGFWQNGKCVILMQESTDLRDAPFETELEIVRASIDTVRRISPFYRPSTFVLGVEATPLRGPAVFEHAFKSDKKVITMKEMANNGAGLPKTSANTREMVRLTGNHMLSGTMAFSADYCCLGRLLTVPTIAFGHDPGRELKLKKMLYNQLQSFKWETNKAGTSGKFSGKSDGNNDGLAVSFMMLPYWSMEFMNKMAAGS